MSDDYVMWLEVKNRINTKTNGNIDLIVLGDSTGKSNFIPNKLKKINSINLSIVGGSPVEGYFTLKTYLKNNPIPKKIIFTYTPMYLSGETSYWIRTVPFEFLAGNEYEEIEQLALQLDEQSILEKNKSFTDYKSPVAYGSNFKNGIRDMRWLRNKTILEESHLSKGHQ
ncbi:MAG: hypothetical protein Q9M34_12055, partial [Sulfurimonas sp.]|nr:hypothetical protein [Sulfurimonas sp.]